jgi:molybdate transport system substrate-binding protein
MRPALFAFLALFTASTAEAAPITVLATGSVTPAVKALAAQFTKETGTEIVLGGGRPDKIVADLKAGARGDVVLVPSASIAAIPNLQTPSVTKIARIAIGVAVPLGAPLPDISTPEKFRTALKAAAKGVSYSDPAIGSSAGPVIDRLLKGPDFAGVKRKPVKDLAIAGLASGEADIALQMITELSAAKTVQLVGPVPDGLDGAVEFSGGILAGAPPEASAFLHYLARPAAAAVWKDAGATPVR